MRFIFLLIGKSSGLLLLLATSVAAFGVSVTVNAPSDGYSGDSPVHLLANASSSHGITGWVVYVDSRIAYQTGATSSIDTNIDMTEGTHQMVVRAWDSTGSYGDHSGQVTVSNYGLPNPPDNAVLVDNIQGRGNWNWCHDAGCAGGSGRGTYWMAQHQGTPSRSGSSMEFYNSGVWANALWWNKFGPNDGAHNFLWDFWVYLDDNYRTAAQTTEYDVFQFVNGYNYMMGTQCNAAAGVWDTWNAGTHHWIHSSIRCPRFSTRTWHHIQMYITTNTSARTYTYKRLVVDGNSSPMNITAPAGYTGWSHNIGAQWQLDVNATGAGYHEWVDDAKLWYW